MLYLLPSDKNLTFPSHWGKIISYLNLWRLGCPILKSAILTERKDINTEYINRIVSHLGSSLCTLRFQYVGPSSSPIRGGNIVEITKENLERFWSEDRVLWPMEPVNRLTDLYGINIAYIPFEEKIIFEIVGRGFDVSDINRGDISPHQIIKLNHPNHRNGKILTNVSTYIISNDKYKYSQLYRKEKLNKMGVDTKDLKFDPVFKPISLGLLSILDKYAQRVFESYSYGEAILSCTITKNGNIVFWDVQTPGGKYETLYKKKSNRTDK